MVEKEENLIEVLTSNEDVENGFDTCFYDNMSGFLHVSFKHLGKTKVLKALINLMEEFNWQIVCINDHCEYGQYPIDSKLDLLRNHPKYSYNWSYVLVKCRDMNRVSEIDKLEPFLSNVFKEDKSKFNRHWEIKGTTYLIDEDLQDKVDLSIYQLYSYSVNKNYGGKMLSLGLNNGIFKLYESQFC